MPLIRGKDVRPVSANGYPPPFDEGLGEYLAWPLSDAGGLTQFGAFVETLQPGSISSLRHWHENEDEFVYLLEGEVVLVEDDGDHVMTPGDAATFKAGVPNGHHLHNRSQEPATYLVVGTRAPHDICHYPDVDLLYTRDANGRRFTRKNGSPLQEFRQAGRFGKMTTYAFVGLGHLGFHLAASLLRAGFAVHAHDRDRSRVAALEKLGAKAAETPADAARAAGNAITCLPSPAVSEAVLAGPRGLLEGLPEGGTWIEMSTNGRDEVLRLAEMAAARGVRTVECPVTGGVHLAAARKITALVGAATEDLAAHRPAIEAMCARVFHMGPVGSAAVIKVITNMLAFIHLVAAGEALMLAKKGGLDLAQAYHAICASSGTSFVHETESQLVLNGSYDIGFTMDLALKDLGFARSMAEEWNVPLDLAARTEAIFRQGKQAYGGDAWSTMIVKLIEDATGTQLRAPGFPDKL